MYFVEGTPFATRTRLSSPLWPTNSNEPPGYSIRSSNVAAGDGVQYSSVNAFPAKHADCSLTPPLPREKKTASGFTRTIIMRRKVHLHLLRCFWCRGLPSSVVRRNPRTAARLSFDLICFFVACRHRPGRSDKGHGRITNRLKPYI